MLKVADFPNISPIWADILDWLLPISKRDNVTSIVGRLVVAATAYFVWQERNNCIHGNGERNPEHITKIIADTVRLKLASIHFKKNFRVDKMRKT